MVPRADILACASTTVFFWGEVGERAKFEPVRLQFLLPKTSEFLAFGICLKINVLLDIIVHLVLVGFSSTFKGQSLYTEITFDMDKYVISI